jgi:hypothetical protein
LKSKSGLSCRKHTTKGDPFSRIKRPNSVKEADIGELQKIYLELAAFILRKTSQASVEYLNKTYGQPENTNQ